MKLICRQGDWASGTCTAHGTTQNWIGIIDNASPGFTINGGYVAFTGDGGLATCGHRFVIVGGSPFFTNGDGSKYVAGTGDVVNMVAPGNGFGTLTTGSPLITIGT